MQTSSHMLPIGRPFPLEYDCGIFTLLFMAFHSQGVSMNFNQDKVYGYCGGHGVRGRLAHMMWKANEL